MRYPQLELLEHTRTPPWPKGGVGWRETDRDEVHGWPALSHGNLLHPRSRHVGATGPLESASRLGRVADRARAGLYYLRATRGRKLSQENALFYIKARTKKAPICVRICWQLSFFFSTKTVDNVKNSLRKSFTGSVDSGQAHKGLMAPVTNISTSYLHPNAPRHQTSQWGNRLNS